MYVTTEGSASPQDGSDPRMPLGSADRTLATGLWLDANGLPIDSHSNVSMSAGADGDTVMAEPGAENLDVAALWSPEPQEAPVVFSEAS